MAGVIQQTWSQKQSGQTILGFKIMIDFHYSDVWADPGHQSKPAAWVGLDFTSLTDTLYNYTRHVMDTLKSNGINPLWVQIGNETNDGMLWENGRASSQYATICNPDQCRIPGCKSCE